MCDIFNPSEGGISTKTNQQPIFIVNKENPTLPVFHYYLLIGLGILAVFLTLYYFHHENEQLRKEKDDDQMKKFFKQAMTEWFSEQVNTSQKITDLQNTQSRVPTHD